MTSKDYSQQVVIERQHHIRGIVDRERSPLNEADIPKLRYFEPNEKYKVHCTIERIPNETVAISTFSGKSNTFTKYGILSFILDGTKCSLTIFQDPRDENHLFIPFTDTTNGISTNDGGRYLEPPITDLQSNIIILDFNLCFNPWCHYSEGFNCPIPPSENKLCLPILAGEMTWSGNKTH